MPIATSLHILRTLHILLLLHKTISRRAQHGQQHGDTHSAINVDSAKSYLKNADEAASCPTTLNNGDNVILSRCYKHDDFNKLCPPEGIETFIGAGGVDSTGGNSGSTISVGDNFMLKSVKKDEAERLVKAIKETWGEGQSLLDPICRIYVESGGETAWALGRTIALNDKTEVAAFDLKSPKFANPDKYTLEELMACFGDTILSFAGVSTQGVFGDGTAATAACEPHDLKTLAYFQSYRALCDGEEFTKLEQLPPDVHLQKQIVPEMVRNKRVAHSVHHGIGNATGVVEPVINAFMSSEDLTCEELSRKWLQKDIAFQKLVGAPFIFKDVITGRFFRDLLNGDIALLHKQELTDYSLFIKVYDDDDGGSTSEPSDIFPFTAKVYLGQREYILAIGIIDYGEKYGEMSEQWKAGTTTMLEPTAYKEQFRTILSYDGYLKFLQ